MVEEPFCKKKKSKKKYTLFKRFLESQNSYVYKLYINAWNEAARLVKNAKKEHQSELASKVKSNPKVFWRYINLNSIWKMKDDIAPLSRDGINFETNDKNNTLTAWVHKMSSHLEFTKWSSQLEFTKPNDLNGSKNA